MIITVTRTDGQIARAFFSEEYKADYALATLDKPYVAFIDGIVMGGTFRQTRTVTPTRPPTTRAATW